MDRLVIIGSGEFGKQTLDISNLQKRYKVIGFYDDFEQEKTVYGIPVLGKIIDIENDFSKEKFDLIFLAIGYNHLDFKLKLSHKLNNIPKANIIHPTATIEQNAILGEGILLYANSYIGSGVKLKNNVTINVGASIPHDNLIGESTFVSVNVTLGGRTKIGKCCFLGLGAIVIDNLTITDNVFLGAGALVVKNIDSEGTYIGSPAKKIR